MDRLARQYNKESPMLMMLCRNRIADFSKWKAVFNSHASAHRSAGLQLRGLWRETVNPDNVFILFEVDSYEKAQAFISDPASAEAGRLSGVLDGEYHFLEPCAGY